MTSGQNGQSFAFSMLPKKQNHFTEAVSCISLKMTASHHIKLHSLYFQYEALSVHR